MMDSCSVILALQSSAFAVGVTLSNDDDDDDDGDMASAASGVLTRLLSASAGTPLYTETKSQYSSPTEATFHTARAAAEACADTKLMTRPEKTGASSLQLRSIRRTTELIPVSTAGGCPLEITTTLRQCNSINL
jgi:hypothetical protein